MQWRWGRSADVPGLGQAPQENKFVCEGPVRVNIWVFWPVHASDHPLGSWAFVPRLGVSVKVAVVGVRVFPSSRVLVSVVYTWSVHGSRSRIVCSGSNPGRCAH